MNSEKSTDYLTRINWKTFVEWLTAEVILNRPIDPLQFTRDIIGSKIVDRDSNDYKPENVTDWLRNSYTEATALVDENGIIHGRVVASAPLSWNEQVSELKKKLDSTQMLLEASKSIACLDPLEATENIISQACSVLDCERATLFTVDSSVNQLVMCATDGMKDIRIPIGQGIAGEVARTGETINIVDAYSDHRFNSSSDKATGFRTVTVLCMAIKSSEGKIVGVLQAINKRDNVFQASDEEVMTLLAAHAGVALQNSSLFKSAELARDKFRSVLDIVKAMQQGHDMGVNSLIFTITQRTTRIVDSDRCTLFLLDNVQRALYAMQGEVNIRISLDQGIAGYVATSGQTLNIPDAYQSPYFNQDIDKKTGYRTKAILCMPIRVDDQIIGVLQLINKISGSGVFNSDDEDVMSMFVSIAGPILASSNVYKLLQGKPLPGEDSSHGLDSSFKDIPVSTKNANIMPKFDETREDDDS